MSQEIMSHFYEAFSRLDATAMGRLYHKDVIFNDPVFTHLSYDETRAMWEMLIERSKGELKVTFHSLKGDDQMTQCTWEARYAFSKTNREVHNIIHSTMEFKDGLIVRHSDQFNFWKWSSMALGTTGKLLGWTPLVKGKVQKTAAQSLDRYMSKA